MGRVNNQRLQRTPQRQAAQPTMPEPFHPRALLFDIGGVLIDIDFRRALQAWAAYSDLAKEEMAQIFQFDPSYQQHERGQISAHDYFSHLRECLKLSATTEEIEAGWNAIFVGEITETRLLVQSARLKIPSYAFTNTNESHMRRWSKRFPEVVAAFDRIFASHQIGLRKPEAAAFEHICNAIGAAPETVLFFDDLDENVRAAESAGLRSVLVTSTQDVSRALQEAGVT